MMNNIKLDPQVQVALTKYDIKHEVIECDPKLADTAAFCEHYGFSIAQAANTIVVMSRKVEPTIYAVCVVLGTHKLDVNKSVCKQMGVKRASFADAETTTRLSNMMIGGVTAIGIEEIPIYVDSAVMAQEKVIMGGGNRSTKVLLSPSELTKIPTVVVVQDLAMPKNDEQS